MYKEKHVLNHHTAGHTLSRYLDVYELNTINCSADKTTGYKGDTVTITGTPAWNEKTSSYSVTGATLTGNQFDFTGSDVTAQANYETAKNVTLQTNGFGSISATPMSGFIGDIVTLSNTPNPGSEFSAYLITGATLIDNIFTLTGTDVTAKAVFTRPLNAKTVRLEFESTSYDPRYDNYQNYMHNKYPDDPNYDINKAWNGGSAAWTQITTNPNVWEYTYSGDNWDRALTNWTWLEDGSHYNTPCISLKVLDINLNGVTHADSMFYYSPLTDIMCELNMSTITSCTRMFQGCDRVKNCLLTNTNNIVDCVNMFLYCFALTGVPSLVDLPNATGCGGMYAYCSAMTNPPTAMNMPKTTSLNGLFQDCYNIHYLPHITAYSATDVRDYAHKDTKVSANVLETYNVLTSQQVEVTNYTGAFYKCGIDTTQGASELAQIPSAWKQGDPRDP